jgi:quercetin dioxygenase-like cupin family protein
MSFARLKLRVFASTRTLSDRRGSDLSEWRPFDRIEGKALEGGGGKVKVHLRSPRGLLLEIAYDKGVASPVHHHEHDSFIYLLEGKLEGTAGEDRVQLRAGDTLLHPARVPHSVRAVETSRFLEFKAPPADEW